MSIEWGALADSGFVARNDQTRRQLEARGLVRRVPNPADRRVWLVENTDEGAEMAKRSRRRHQIVLGFLQAIGVPPEAAEIDAEGIEHHVSDETLAVFERIATKGL